MKKVISGFAILLVVSFVLSCNQNDDKKRKDLLGLYFDNLYNVKSSIGGEAFTKPISESLAMKEIDTFYASIKPGNPKMKCLIDISHLSELLLALKVLGADGIRLYSAAYTKEGVQGATTEIRNVLKEGDLHLIIVPIKKDGTEIKTNDIGNSVIYNYNNDCPHNCPTNWNNASLIDSKRRDSCK